MSTQPGEAVVIIKALKIVSIQTIFSYKLLMSLF